MPTVYSLTTPSPWYSSASNAPLAHTAKATPFHPWKIAINHLSGSIWSYVNQEFSLSVLDVPCLEGSSPSTNPKICNNKRRDVRGTRIHHNTQYTHTIIFGGYCWIILERRLSIIGNDSSDALVIISSLIVIMDTYDVEVSCEKTEIVTN